MDIAMVWSIKQTLLELGADKITIKKWCMEDFRICYMANNMFIRKEAMNNAARCVIYTLCLNAQIFSLPGQLGCNNRGTVTKGVDFDGLFNNKTTNGSDLLKDLRETLRKNVSQCSSSDLIGNSITSSRIGNKIKIDPVTKLRLIASRANFAVNDDVIATTVCLFYHDSNFNERIGYGLGTKEWLKVHGNTSSGAKLYKWVYDKLIVLGVISGLPLSDRDRHKGDWMPQMPHLIPSENIKKFNCVLSECIDAKWYLIKKCRRKQIAALQPSLLLYLETIHFLYPSLVGIDMVNFKMWLSGEIDANELYNKCRVDMDRVAEEIYDPNNNDDDSD